MTVMTSPRNADLIRRLPEVLTAGLEHEVTTWSAWIACDHYRDPVVVGGPDQALPNRGASIRIP